MLAEIVQHMSHYRITRPAVQKIKSLPSGSGLGLAVNAVWRVAPLDLRGYAVCRPMPHAE
jgi:hypothetical protein